MEAPRAGWLRAVDDTWTELADWLGDSIAEAERAQADQQLRFLSERVQQVTSGPTGGPVSDANNASSAAALLGSLGHQVLEHRLEVDAGKVVDGHTAVGGHRHGDT